MKQIGEKKKLFHPDEICGALTASIKQTANEKKKRRNGINQ